MCFPIEIPRNPIAPKEQDHDNLTLDGSMFPTDIAQLVKQPNSSIAS
jgi:hypothetical protein